MHRTQSIFLRNLAPNITKQEVEAVSDFSLSSRSPSCVECVRACACVRVRVCVCKIQWWLVSVQMCAKYLGYMRVALQDPQPERNFFRRGWVTFNKSVVIKNICWNLNNIRVSALT